MLVQSLCFSPIPSRWPFLHFLAAARTQELPSSYTLGLVGTSAATKGALEQTANELYRAEFWTWLWHMSFKCDLGHSRNCPASMSGSNRFLFTPTWVTVYVTQATLLTPTWTCAIIMVITYHPQLHHHQRIANRINFANHLQTMNAPPIIFFIHEDCPQAKIEQLAPSSRFWPA